MNGKRLGAPMRAFLLVTALLLSGCAGAPDPSEDAEVVASFYPLAWLTQRIAGDNITVATLVPPGIEPHDWEPVAQDVARVADATLIVTQGAGFEPWLDGILANLGDKAPRVIDSTAGVALVEGEEEHEGEEAAGEEEGGPHYDPHTWLDPTLFAQQAATIEAALVEAFPAEAATIRANAAKAASDLDALHAEYEAGLAACEVRIVVANHDAYSYLASRYNFRVVALSGLSPEAEPSPDALADAIEVAREHNITIIFFEELVSPRVAEVVADEVGAQTRVLSPIESAPQDGDYLSLMRANLLGVREAMRCT